MNKILKILQIAATIFRNEGRVFVLHDIMRKRCVPKWFFSYSESYPVDLKSNWKKKANVSVSCWLEIRF